MREIYCDTRNKPAVSGEQSSDQPKQCCTVLPKPNHSIKVLFAKPKWNRTEHVKST